MPHEPLSRLGSALSVPRTVLGLRKLPRHHSSTLLYLDVWFSCWLLQSYRPDSPVDDRCTCPMDELYSTLAKQWTYFGELVSCQFAGRFIPG